MSAAFLQVKRRGWRVGLRLAHTALHARTQIFPPVSARYERGSIIVTSNKSCGEWGSIRGERCRLEEWRRAGLVGGREQSGEGHAFVTVRSRGFPIRSSQREPQSGAGLRCVRSPALLHVLHAKNKSWNVWVFRALFVFAHPAYWTLTVIFTGDSLGEVAGLGAGVTVTV
jgi:hypothetical protein